VISIFGHSFLDRAVVRGQVAEVPHVPNMLLNRLTDVEPASPIASPRILLRIFAAKCTRNVVTLENFLTSRADAFPWSLIDLQQDPIHVSQDYDSAKMTSIRLCYNSAPAIDTVGRMKGETNARTV
jgi:hypothetical protein